MATAAKSKSKKIAPLGTARIPKADLDPGNLRLQGKKMSVRLSQALTDTSLEQRIDGSSTLTLVVYDYSRALLRSQLLSGPVTLTFDNVPWTLVKVATSENALTLTFEETGANLLRQYTQPKKSDRDTTTRAQFVRSMITEVKEYKIPYRIPEVNVKQPIGTSSSSATPPTP